MLNLNIGRPPHSLSPSLPRWRAPCRSRWCRRRRRRSIIITTIPSVSSVSTISTISICWFPRPRRGCLGRRSSIITTTPTISIFWRPRRSRGCRRRTIPISISISPNTCIADNIYTLRCRVNVNFVYRARAISILLSILILIDCDDALWCFGYGACVCCFRFGGCVLGCCGFLATRLDESLGYQALQYIMEGSGETYI